MKTNLAEVEERGGEIAVTLQAACNLIQNVLINKKIIKKIIISGVALKLDFEKLEEAKEV